MAEAGKEEISLIKEGPSQK